MASEGLDVEKNRYHFLLLQYTLCAKESCYAL